MKKKMEKEMDSYETEAKLSTLMEAAKIKKDKELMKKLKKAMKDKMSSVEIEFEGIEDEEEDDMEEPSSIDGIREKANKKAMKKYEE